MRRNLHLEGRVLNFLSLLDGKHYKQVTGKIFKLLENPAPHDRVLMQGYQDVWRTDIGERRIIYSYTDELVNILMVGKRNDDEIYRDFDRTH
jgi:mRNA interferase RelE/StbE